MRWSRTRRRAAAVLAGAVSVGLAVSAPARVHGDDLDADASVAAADDPVAELATIVEESGEPIGLRGPEAVAALDEVGLLETVAAEHDLGAEELTELLESDPTLAVTPGASLAYVDVRPELPASEELVAGDPPTAEFTAPAGFDVNALESLPGVRRVLYLDFDGYVTNDPYWNSGAPPWPGVSAPYPGTNAQKYEIWRRVGEDFAPFGVNVTTRDPGVEGLRKTSAADDAYGQRMVISPTNWTGDQGTLGIALVDVFDMDDHPAYVFTAGLSVAHVAEAVSHEAGHTFGLDHDGIGGLGYYDGHGVWAPIMGRPLSKPVTQWSRGEYDEATNPENDVAIIAGHVGYRADEAGSSPSGAKVVACATKVQGIIGSGDTDMYAADVGAGTLTVTLAPAEPWTNLLARLVVRGPSGALVGADDPATPTGWSTTVSQSVSAGRYTFHVVPVGWGDVNTGFSTYGSMGQYTLTVSGTAPGAGTCQTRLTPTTPARLLDTRHGTGGSTRLAAGTQAVVQVTGRGGVPSGATAAIVNVTAVSPSGWGYLTVHPCEVARPETSNVNYVAGQIVANNTIAALSPAGQLCVWTYADADILVDVTGWLGPGGGSRLTAVGPSRVVDTRVAKGGTRLGAGQTLTVDLSGKVPAAATSVAFNLTAVGAGRDGYLTVSPCGGTRPTTSAVNYVPGEARPNNVIVGLGAVRKVCVYSDADVDVIVDLTGHFSPTGALSYVPTVPKRVLDTRGGQVRAPMPAGSVLEYAVTKGLPTGNDPDAAFVNVTSLDHPVDGYVTTYACGTRPYTSTVNQVVGQVNANGAIVPLDPASRSCGYLSDPAHLLVDLNGWWVR